MFDGPERFLRDFVIGFLSTRRSYRAAVGIPI